jgi:hypothetical protein
VSPVNLRSEAGNGPAGICVYMFKLVMRPLAHWTWSLKLQLQGSDTAVGHLARSVAEKCGSRLKCCHAMQSLEVRFAELPVQALGEASHAIAQAEMFRYAPVALKARLHWPFGTSHSKLTQQSMCRPLLHSSWTQPSQLSTDLSQGLQHVSHTSHPVNVWLQTVDLLYSPQFSGCSHGTTEATEAPTRAKRLTAKTGIFSGVFSFRTEVLKSVLFCPDRFGLCVFSL